jgi:hypothetical protein
MDQTGEANAAAVVSPAAAAPAPTAAAATASAAVVSPAAAASAASPAKASGVVISRHKNSILVSGSTFRHKNVLSSLGGRWNKPLKGWIFGGGKRDAVFDGLRALLETSRLETVVVLPSSPQQLPRTTSRTLRPFLRRTKV